jgi:hypothetical protein
MPFEPQQHLIKLPRKVKDKATGQYAIVYDDYLEVKFRVVMFRERYPHGVITTEEIAVDLDRGYARYKTIVQDGEGGMATGFGTETQADFGDFAERAETRALGRALAVMGFGTQFVGQDLTEGEHVADAPVTHGHPDTPVAAPSSINGKDRPTEADITALTTLAVVTCADGPEVFAQRLRRTMGLKPSASVAPKLLTRTMSMAHYQEVLAYYQRLQAQLERPTEERDGTASPATPASIPAPPPAQEAPSDIPFVASSSAPASVSPEASTVAAGPGPEDRQGYATPEQITALKRLAAQVGPEAAEDLADVLEHSSKGLLLDVHTRISTRLEARLHGQTAAAVA